MNNNNNNNNKICMNTSCGANTSSHWKKGWPLKSGQLADLCFNCGSVYDNMLFCETFHAQQSGWRECSLCTKRLHCGCIASVAFLEIQDFGGVWCIKCARPAPSHQAITNARPCQLESLVTNNIANPNNLVAFANLNDNHTTTPTPFLPLSHNNDPATASSMQSRWNFTDFTQAINANANPFSAQLNQDNSNSGVKDIQPSPVPSLNLAGLQSPPDTASNFSLNFATALDEGDHSRTTPLQPGQRPRHILPKPPKATPLKPYDANKSSFSPMRVGRPPAEGRLRNQLLPRYWPRITDQELQKLSGALNSNIVPLFEKVLSTSDASKIGRLVLPKACAEAYFPPINQSEGLPLKVQDVKGNEWTLQFRFWPNNNSRMYVLEGVTPCMQSMQLQAGDTVTFSRMDPGGKLVIGFRKASNTTELQDTQTSSVITNGSVSGENSVAHVTDSMSTCNGHIVPLSTGSDKDNVLSALPEKSEMVIGDTAWNKSEKPKSLVNEDVSQQPKLTPDKKRMRNISSKNKRLLMHGEDAIELKLSWEETQDLLRAPLAIKPNVVTIDDFEFEEYSEPPVFGKRTYFTTRLSGGQEQWAQCDKCSKWRKLPADALLPPVWSCSENVWDLSRSSCATLEETNSKELEIVFRLNKDIKKRKGAENVELGQGCEPQPCGLDALATAATLGDNEEPAVGATTRHPRHRAGCTCIVCIQPPSGKGKHKSSCVCNVCLTVKRRFKTLMMRKKKRQCEREAEMAQQKSHDRPIKRLRIMKNGASDDIILDKSQTENETQQEKSKAEGESSSSGPIDLNCHPSREEVFAQLSGATTSLTQVAKDSVEMSVSANGSANSLPKPQTEARLSSPQEGSASGEGSSFCKDDGHTSTTKAQEVQEGVDEDARKAISE